MYDSVNVTALNEITTILVDCLSQLVHTSMIRRIDPPPLPANSDDDGNCDVDFNEMQIFDHQTDSNEVRQGQLAQFRVNHGTDWAQPRKNNALERPKINDIVFSFLAMCFPFSIAISCCSDGVYDIAYNIA